MNITYREAVRMNPTLSQQAQFDHWLASLAPCCSRHRGTRLKLDQDATRRSRAFCRAGEFYAWRDFDAAIPDNDREQYYPFEAHFWCPACKLSRGSFPPKFHQCRFEDFQTPTQELRGHLAKCREFVEQVNARHCGFLLMCGMPGNGKTRLSATMAGEIIGPEALYLTQGQMTLQHRLTYGRRHVHLHRRGEEPDDHPPTVWESAQSVSLLVLDELGTKAMSPDEMLLVDEILKHRHDHFKPTIMISNLPLQGTPGNPGLKEFLGDSLADRIAEANGNGRFNLQFSGGSFRRRAENTYLLGLAQQPSDTP